MSTRVKVAITAPAARTQLMERFEGLEDVQSVWSDSEDDYKADCVDADILVIPAISYTPGIADTLMARPRPPQFIQLLTAGYEQLTTFGVPTGVPVANAGDIWSPVVADHALGLILGLARGVPRILANQARSQWDYADVAPNLWTLKGRTLTVVGFGSIGREVASRAQAFGMQVIGVTRSGNPDPMADEMYPVSQLGAALGRADVVVLAVPLGPETRHIMDADAFRACKPEAIVVNVARGGVMDGSALVRALEDGTIAGAAIDVAEPEPLPSDSPLWHAPNLIISPHVAGAGGEGYFRYLADMAAENVVRFIRGETPQNLVMPD